METQAQAPPDNGAVSAPITPGELPKQIVLTYETLYEMLRREKERSELQKLPETFLLDTLSYLREKDALLQKTRHKADIFSADERRKLTLQIQNIRSIIREIYDRRERKIMEMALSKSRTGTNIIDTTPLLTEERAMHDIVVSELESQRRHTLHCILELREPDIPVAPVTVQTTPTTRHVKFTQHVDEFVGSQLEKYGPFNTDDSAYLPAEIADILVAQGSATFLD